MRETRNPGIQINFREYGILILILTSFPDKFAILLLTSSTRSVETE
jgi:hypothetical protein